MDRSVKAISMVSLFLLMGACSSGPKVKEMTTAERATLFVELANASLVEGDPTGALQSLVKAEEIDSSLPEIYHSRALAFYGKHDLKTAIVNARKAVEMAPTYADASNTLGKLLVDAGRYEEAETVLKISAENPLYRDAYKSWTNLGIARYRRGDYQTALKYFDSAIQSSKHNACVAYYYRGHIRLRESRFKEAISSYDLATRKFCASFGDAHLALGIAYEKSRQYDKARSKFLEIQERYPNTDFANQAVTHLRYLP